MNITNFPDEGNPSGKDGFISNFIPPLSVILGELHDFHEPLQIALEEGVRQGRDYFQVNALPTDVFLFSQLIRYHTKLVMKQKASVNLYEMDDLANNGLSGVHNGYHIRIFKGYHGNIPVPNSDTKAAFFCQQLELGLELAPLIIAKPNVFFLWELDSNLALMPLRIVCPRYGEKGHDVTTTYYNEIVANPAITKGPDYQQGKGNRTISSGPLDIRLKGEDANKHDNKNDNEKKS